MHQLRIRSIPTVQDLFRWVVDVYVMIQTMACDVSFTKYAIIVKSGD